MGMYDYVKCEYALPVEELENAMENPPNWSEIEFQTKSLGQGGLGGFLDQYTIEDDGQIYVEKRSEEWIEDESAPMGYITQVKEEGIERQDFTGELHMYGMHMGEENDFYFDFKALFWKGDLKEVKLDDWKKEDNEFRKNAQEQLKKKLLEMDNPKISPLKIFKSIIIWPVSIIRYLLNSIVSLIWRIERWLN